MTDYTRKQRDAINSAYSIMVESASCTDWSMEFKLKRGFAYERKQRSCAWAAKALMVESFRQGYAGHHVSLSDLYGISDGCAQAVLCGARMKDRYPDALPSEWHAIADACKANHRAAIDTALDRIKREG